MVRSKGLALGRQVAANVFTTVYTVPADRTLILRTITVQNQGAVATDVTLRAVNSDNAVSARFLFIAALAAQDHRQLDVWHVLEEGDSLEVRAGATNVLNYWFSGSLLLGDPA